MEIDAVQPHQQKKSLPPNKGTAKPFSGKCYGCRITGHRQRDCPTEKKKGPHQTAVVIEAVETDFTNDKDMEDLWGPVEVPHREEEGEDKDINVLPSPEIPSPFNVPAEISTLPGEGQTIHLNV